VKTQNFAGRGLIPALGFFNWLDLFILVAFFLSVFELVF